MRLFRVLATTTLAAVPLLGAGVALAGATGYMPGRHIDREGNVVQELCPKELAGADERTCFSSRVINPRANASAREAESVGPQGVHPYASSCDPDAGTFDTFQTQWMLGATEAAQLYDLSGVGMVTGNVPIVALVDAYGYSTALTDVNAYRAQFGLAAIAQCTGATPTPTAQCFAQVGQTGSTPPADPTGTNAGWMGESALDLDMVTAGCPGCSILLVEANSASNSDLDTAVDYAAGVTGVVVVSNSYGSSESSAATTEDSHYTHPGVLIAAASGDQDYLNQGTATNGDTLAKANYPASSPNVLAVGGTTPGADPTQTRGFKEQVWNMGIIPTGNTTPANAAEGTGSGCSTVFATPSGQVLPSGSGCSKRATNDVSAAACWVSTVEATNDAGTVLYNDAGQPLHWIGGIGVYQAGCWQEVWGTSAATPLVSAIFARTGLAATVGAAGGLSAVYNNASYFYDITKGTNDVTGKCAAGSILCNAVAGWDGPTGMGTPNGAIIAQATGVAVWDAGPVWTDAGSDGGSSPTNDGGTTPTKDGGSTPTKDGGSTPTKDGGTMPTQDGGTDPLQDGGSPSQDGAMADSGNPNSDGGTSGSTSSKGCSCDTTGSSAPASGAAAGLLLGLVALVSRRRTRTP